MSKDVLFLVDKKSDLTIIAEDPDGDLVLRLSKKKKFVLDSKLYNRNRDTKAMRLFEKLLSNKNFIYLE